MIIVTSLIGSALVLLGFGVFFGSDATGAEKWTSLIPAVFGVILVALAAAGSRSPGARKHAAHAAVVLTTLGFILSMGRLVPSLFADGPVNQRAAFSLTAMAVLCLLHVWFSIRSFIHARRERKIAEAKAKSAGPGPT